MSSTVFTFITPNTWLLPTRGLFLLWEAFHLGQECAWGEVLRLFLSKPFPSSLHSPYPVSSGVTQQLFLPEQEACRDCPPPSGLRVRAEDPPPPGASSTRRLQGPLQVPGPCSSAPRTAVWLQLLSCLVESCLFSQLLTWFLLETPFLPLPHSEAVATSHCPHWASFQISLLLFPLHLFLFRLSQM